MARPTPTRSSRSSKPKRPPGDIGGNQGEGNREADRRYREKATEFAESERAEPAAEEARRSVEGQHVRDAGAGDQLEQIERRKREQRRALRDDPAGREDDEDPSS